ncbi:hypothetical protein [Bacteroides sedimenti]|uniref:hypothetical protein n=1 Tax=Bacteroides sedimenti TaxID=2136147 RepID=UPI0033428C26
MNGLRTELHQPAYQKDFARLSSEWIITFFHLQRSDRAILNAPQGYIPKEDGQIFLSESFSRRSDIIKEPEP